MVFITFSPSLARILIAKRERGSDSEKCNFLENAIQKGNWDNVPPIWVTPNLLFNGIFCGFFDQQSHPTIKPLIIYNGHHRFDKALEHNLPIKAYIRYTFGNPKMPEKEVLVEDTYY